MIVYRQPTTTTTRSSVCLSTTNLLTEVIKFVVGSNFESKSLDFLSILRSVLGFVCGESYRGLQVGRTLSRHMRIICSDAKTLETERNRKSCVLSCNTRFFSFARRTPAQSTVLQKQRIDDVEHRTLGFVVSYDRCLQPLFEVVIVRFCKFLWICEDSCARQLGSVVSDGEIASRIAAFVRWTKFLARDIRYTFSFVLIVPRQLTQCTKIRQLGTRIARVYRTSSIL